MWSSHGLSAYVFVILPSCFHGCGFAGLRDGPFTAWHDLLGPPDARAWGGNEESFAYGTADRSWPRGCGAVGVVFLSLSGGGTGLRLSLAEGHTETPQGTRSPADVRKGAAPDTESLKRQAERPCGSVSPTPLNPAPFGTGGLSEKHAFRMHQRFRIIINLVIGFLPRQASIFAWSSVLFSLLKKASQSGRAFQVLMTR